MFIRTSAQEFFKKQLPICVFKGAVRIAPGRKQII
jgi:hypothetical protein